MTEYAATSIQRRYAMLRANAERRFDNITATFELEGAVDAELLERALHLLARRHDLLRTRFVNRNTDFVLETIDLPDMLLQLQEQPACRSIKEELARYAFEASRQSIDIMQAPLFRACLLSINGTTHRYLIFTIHHNIADAASIWVIVRDLGAVYSALVTQKSINLPDISGRYSKYVAAERLLIEERTKANLSWWSTYLEGYRPPVVAPETITLDAVAALTMRVIPGTVERIRLAPGSAGLSIGTIICCVYSDALTRCGMGGDLLINNIVSGRNGLTRGLVGDFVNHVPVRVKRSNGSFTARARALSDVVKSAQARQVPYWHLTRTLFADHYLQAYGLTGIEYNVLGSYPRLWVDTPHLRISFVADVTPLPASPQFEWCLAIGPEIGRDWQVTLLYNTNTVSPDLAENVFQEIKTGIDRLAHY